MIERLFPCYRPYDTQAAALEKQLRELEGTLSPAKALEQPVVKETRTLLKKVSVETETINKCRKIYNAVRLGVTEQTLDASPGFENFATKYCLYNYLKTYNHTLQVDDASNEVWIRCNNEYIPWSQAKSVVSEHSALQQPSLRWVYGEEGLQDKDLYIWKVPDHFKSTEKTGTFFFFCACEPEDKGLNGYHTWFCIVYKGKIYSIGKYRPGKNKDFINKPLRVQPGYIQSPDVSEFWGTTIYQSDWEKISEEGAEKVLKKIEEIKANEGDFEFHNVNKNCVVFNNEMAELAGAKVRLEAKVHAWRVITPQWLQNGVDSIAKVAPCYIRLFAEKITTFVLNIIGVIFLGAAKKDEKLSHTPSLPHINNGRDLWEPETLRIHHPKQVIPNLKRQNCSV
ncbi:MAG: hypothetical protein KDK72_09785 [Chlamydiia bacterium]|nr:hypothetical protein [Chlamydiia bacterium]